MEFLKKTGEFLKSHYEKVLLSVILLLLAAAAAYLPIKISDNRKRITEIVTVPPPRAVPLLKPTDLTTNDALLKRVEKLEILDLAKKHHVFNPHTWKMLPDGRIIKIDSPEREGAGALLVTKITPLNLTIRYEGVRGAGEDARYGFVIDRAVSSKGAPRRTTAYISPGGNTSISNPGGKADTLTLRKVEGPPEAPTALILEVSNMPGQLKLTTDQPSLTNTIGYVADLKYPLESNKEWTDRRVGQQLEFAGEKYNIVAITEKEVKVQAPNGNRTTIGFQAASTAAADGK
jgi:hypothetical protein